MPVNTIDIQPGTDAVVSAYSNIVFQVTAVNADGRPAPDLVECDVYINGSFYRQYPRARYESVSGMDSVWRFEVQETAQEVLTTTPPASNNIPVSDGLSFCTLQCKFRAWTKDTEGLLSPESNTLDSFVCHVVNVSIDDNDLEGHLTLYKVGEWDPALFPLTHRPNYYLLCPGDRDSYPILRTDHTIANIRINYQLRQNSNVETAEINIVDTSGLVVYVPTGPAELGFLFSTANGSPVVIDFKEVSRYSVQLLDTDQNVIMTTPEFELGGCCDSEDKIRIVFRNTLGTRDAINLELVHLPVTLKSAAYQTGSTDSTQHSVNRYGVDYDKTYICRGKAYGEKNQPWIGELQASTLAWRDTGTEFIPIVILDSTFDLIKETDRYLYEVEVQFKYSRKKREIRN